MALFIYKLRVSFSKLTKILNRRKSVQLIAAICLFGIMMSTISITGYAQEGETGKITGILVDHETGDPLIGANVIIEGTTMGASTDLEGAFSITSVPVGTYTILILYVGYQETRITEVEIVAGESFKIDLGVKTEAITTDEVVVTAKLLENTEASLMKKRQKSAAVSDAVSAEEFAKTGSSDAADAVKQVVGASVVDGKYVYVRGLGDRYSNTQLNGAELPSSDPYKKAFQLDLLPTNLLDNIVTVKTFTPDRPGNFSGGIVDVATKAFPEDFTFKIGYSASVHSIATGNSNFLTYAGGDRDWLGTDDGTRALPDVLADGTITQDDLPSSRTDVRTDPAGDKGTASVTAGSSFTETMDFVRTSAPVNQGFSLSVGDQVATGGNTSLGYMASLTYKRSYDYYDNGEVGIYSLNPGATELNPQVQVSDEKGEEIANIGGLGTLTFNINPEQQIGGNVFYSRSGISTSRFQQGAWPQELDYDRVISNRVLTYTERDVLSSQIRGKHLIRGLFNTTAEWNASFSKTSQLEPDRRLIFSFVDTSRATPQYTILGSNFDKPSRYYRNLDDTGNIFNLHFTMPFSQWSGMASKFKFGGMYQKKDRDFQERIFSYLPDNDTFNEVDGDVSALFQHENLELFRDSTKFGFPVRGNVLTENSRLRNNYVGDQKIQGVYGMVDMPFSRKLRVIGGLRLETTDMEVVSNDSTLEVGRIDEDDLLPSLNVVYFLSNNMNLRLAGTRTLARPNFREIAPYSSKEFVNDFDFAGNPSLQRTLIVNVDARWEWFLRPGEILAFSAFYKEMTNPIERTFASGTTESNRIVTLDNVDKARIFGLEFEARSRLDKLAGFLSNFSFGGNLSLVKSEVDIAGAELENRLAIDSTASTTRNLQGQSPYTLNLDLTYSQFRWGTTASLHFNTFGERLSGVSRGATPDVFERPFNLLSFTLNQRLWQSLSANFAVNNILDSEYQEIYKFDGGDAFFQRYNRGISYSFGITYGL